MIYKRLEEFKNIILDTTCTTEKDLVDIDQSFSLFKNYLLQTKKNDGLTYIIGNGGIAQAGHLVVHVKGDGREIGILIRRMGKDSLV